MAKPKLNKKKSFSSWLKKSEVNSVEENSMPTTLLALCQPIFDIESCQCVTSSSGIWQWVYIWWYTFMSNICSRTIFHFHFLLLLKCLRCQNTSAPAPEKQNNSEITLLACYDNEQRSDIINYKYMWNVVVFFFVFSAL